MHSIKPKLSLFLFIPLMLTAANAAIAQNCCWSHHARCCPQVTYHVNPCYQHHHPMPCVCGFQNSGFSGPTHHYYPSSVHFNDPATVRYSGDNYGCPFGTFRFYCGGRTWCLSWGGAPYRCCGGRPCRFGYKCCPDGRCIPSSQFCN